MRTAQKGAISSAGIQTDGLVECSFNEIEDPGSYLLVESGSLVRVPAEALVPGHWPILSITSLAKTKVARLSTNPAAPISALRRIAAANDLFVNF